MAVVSTSLRLLTILVLGGFLCVDGTARAQSSRTMTDTIAVDDDVEVELHAVRGRVEVTTWERPAVRLHGEIEDAASMSDEAPAIQVAREDGVLTITPNGETVEGAEFFTVLGAMTWGRDWERDEPEGPKTVYSVRVPADASVTLSLDAADAEVSGVTGDVMIEGVSSSIELRNLRGTVLAGTVSGPLHAEDVRGKLSVGTLSGNLRATLSSLAGDLDVGTLSGDATITLPPDAAFDLETDILWGGGVTSDFAAPDSATQGDGPVPIGGGGGATVAFESFTGTLTLRAAH